MFEFKILKKNTKSRARTGIFHTPHGNLETPEYAFVATEGELKAIPKKVLSKLPVKYMIVNTFHIWVKKILQEIQKENGIHNFMNYKNVCASDSGGFQVFSMGFGKAHSVGKVGRMLHGEKFEARNPKSETNSNKQSLNDQNSFENSKLKNSNIVSSFDIRNSDLNNPLKITEKGVEFIFNGKKIFLTPEKSMQIQQKIGADIIFAFDECTSPLNSKEYTKHSMERTHRWITRCINQLKLVKTSQSWLKLTKYRKPISTNLNQFQQISTNKQALFAIVQGGYFEDLRKISAKYMAKLDVPGFGIGGSLGTTEDEVRDVIDWTIPYLPEEKPRHLLGIGKVKDVFDSVERGIDLFDCVIPTREARHQVLYTKKGKMQMRKMRNEKRILEKNCTCITCKEKITWKHLAGLFSQKNPQAFFYATVHNIQFFSDLMKNIRFAIEKNTLATLKEKYLRYY